LKVEELVCPKSHIKSLHESESEIRTKIEVSKKNF